MANEKRRTIMTLTGPSGSGKTCLVKELCEHNGFAKLISVTTRPKRTGEVEGEDYYFLNGEQFSKLHNAGDLLQYVKFNGFEYGTSKQELQRVFDSGLTPVVIVEPSGIEHFRKIAQENDCALKTVFLTAQKQVLIRRYLERVVSEKDLSRMDYHAKRLAAIDEEESLWPSSEKFDIVLTNSSDEISEIEFHAQYLRSQV